MVEISFVDAKWWKYYMWMKNVHNCKALQAAAQMGSRCKNYCVQLCVVVCSSVVVCSVQKCAEVCIVALSVQSGAQGATLWDEAVRSLPRSLPSSDT